MTAGLERALGPETDAEAARWQTRIERLRERLLGDTTPLELTDFGAGHAGAGAPRGTVRRTVAEMCRASKSPFWCRILFELVRATGPARAVELGTCLGISCSYQAAAQQVAGGGDMWTLEGAAALAARARAHFDELGLDRVRVVEGPFSETLGTVLEEAAPVAWAFVDGHHEERATVEYFETFLPRLAETAVLVFDDIAWSAGMRRAWRTVRSHPRVVFSAALGQMGICVVAPERHPPLHLELPLGTFS